MSLKQAQESVLDNTPMGRPVLGDRLKSIKCLCLPVAHRALYEKRR